MPRLLGLRNIVCSKEDWHYLVFYDIDRPIGTLDIVAIDEIMQTNQIAYILYKSKSGVHFVGFTPVDALTWAMIFTQLKLRFKEYYSGNVIRISQKEGEVQQLIKLEISGREVIPNLYNLYAKRFSLPKMPWVKEGSKYLLVFEKYRSVKA